MARVAVLGGGLGSERPVSQVSARECSAALTRLGHTVLPIDPLDEDWIERLRATKADAVFNALHGEYGEDGRTQGVLDYLRIPYTHSGVLASALGMDKNRAKAVFAGLGLPLAKGMLVNRFTLADSHPLEPPYVIKPNAAGSSVGVHIIRPGTNRPPTELSSHEYAFGDEVLVEEFIPGKELSVAVLGNRALTVTEIIPSTDYYDYEAKYSEGGSRHEVPAKIDAKAFEAAKKAAEEAHRALGCRGVTRTDFRFDPERGRLVLLEINTQPGMTPTSLAPEQAAHAGMPYDALVQWMLEDASWPR